MALARHLISAITLCTVTLCSPVSALAREALSTDGHPPAGTAINFAIIIPAVLRILENSHPLSLPVANTPDAHISVSQRLVLVSTLGKGFCMDLQLSQQHLTDWQLRVSGSTGTRIEPSAGGYRLCIGRAGRYEMVLQHDFHLKDGPRADPAPALGWPVHISLAAP
jgi:hypothetical protein